MTSIFRVRLKVQRTIGILFRLLRNISLNFASHEQDLGQLKKRLAEIVPDLTNQYTSFHITGDYLINKVRSLHAFQIKLALDAIALLGKNQGDKVNCVDIGDSSGTHLT